MVKPTATLLGQPEFELEHGDLASASYDELRAAVARWLARTEDRLDVTTRGAMQARLAQRNPPPAHAPTRQASAALARRGFDRFAARVSPASHLQRALFDLFVTARLQRYVLAYASIQEGRDWDTQNTVYPHTSALLRGTLLGLGKVSMVGLVMHWGNTSYRWSLDPLNHLRSAYASHLRLHRRPRANAASRAWWQLRQTGSIVVYKMASRAAANVATALLRAWKARTASQGISALLSSEFCRRQIANSVRLLFPTAAHLTDHDRSRLLDLISDYLADVLPKLLEVLPSDSKRDDGIAKLVKLAFGVIAGRVSERDRHEPDEVAFIFNSVRLAYSWGITYPLVDNVIDSAATTDSNRSSLLARIGTVFDGELTPSPPDNGSGIEHEVVRRLTEVMGLLHARNAASARHTLRLLLTAHRYDSQRRLSSMSEAPSVGEEQWIWIDSILKAALVRTATLQICGTDLTPTMLSDQVHSGAINQFGDDLWDVKKDIEADRVTPFTVSLMYETQRDPFMFFARYCACYAQAQTRVRCAAMYIGVQETSRCFLQELPLSATAGIWCDARDRTIQALASLDSMPIDLEALRAVPHVDLDAVVFNLTRAVLAGQGTDHCCSMSGRMLRLLTPIRRPRTAASKTRTLRGVGPSD